jgi:anti-sigma factor RsiW
MTCAELEALLCDYVDGTLPAERAALVREHLAACRACAELAADAAAVVAFARRAEPVQPPDALITRLLFHVSTAPPVVKRRGLRALLGRWAEPVLQPRFAMGMAMTILSISLLARSLGMPGRTLRPADLRPSAVIAAVDDRLHRAWDSAVKYYENLRVVYEIRNRLNQWASQQEAGTAPEEQAPAEAPPAPQSPEAGKKRSEQP